MTGLLTILSTKPLDASAVAFARQRGWEVREKSFIEVRPLAGTQRDRLPRRREGELLVFTSAHSVEFWSAPGPCRSTLTNSLPVACLSGRTTDAVRTLDPSANIVATAPSAAALAIEILRLGTITHVIFPCALHSRMELPESLEAAGIAVERFPVYETIATPVAIEGAFDAILFFSPSGVDSFFECNPTVPAAACFAIGETTASALKAHTDKPIIVAAEPTQTALLETVQLYFYGKE